MREFTITNLRIKENVIRLRSYTEVEQDDRLAALAGNYEADLHEDGSFVLRGWDDLTPEDREWATLIIKRSLATRETHLKRK